jgi:hypothetical protein
MVMFFSFKLDFLPAKNFTAEVLSDRRAYLMQICHRQDNKLLVTAIALRNGTRIPHIRV